MEPLRTVDAVCPRGGRARGAWRAGAVAALVAGLGACAAPGAPQGGLRGLEPEPARGWVQGIFALADVGDTGFDPQPGLVEDELRLGTVPYVGAAWQVPLNDAAVRVGWEAGGMFGWRTDSRTEDQGNGLILVVDDEFLVLEGFAGLLVSAQAGELVRLYAAAGPSVNYAQVDTELLDATMQPREVDGSGWGLGWYARTGVEVQATPDLAVGVGARFVDSTIDLGRDLGDLDYDALQILLTFTATF